MKQRLWYTIYYGLLVLFIAVFTIAGHCSKTRRCSISADCPGTQICGEGGRCVNRCQTTRDCHQGWKCIEGECKEIK